MIELARVRMTLARPGPGLACFLHIPARPAGACAEKIAKDEFQKEKKRKTRKRKYLIKANGTHDETIGQVIDRTLVETL